MAWTKTTLSSAVSVNDNSIVVASATSIAAGNVLFINKEKMQVAKGYASGTTIPVLRGQHGTMTIAHASGDAVVNGIGALDFPPTPAGETIDGEGKLGTWHSQNVTATGATGSTSTALTSAFPALVTVTGVSGAGVGLPTGAAVPGAYYVIKNKMTGALSIYAVGATINGTTGTTALVATATGNFTTTLMCVNAGAWETVPVAT